MRLYLGKEHILNSRLILYSVAIIANGMLTICGAGMYLAYPDGSLLLPPTTGWVSLTGSRSGAPEMCFI